MADNSTTKTWWLWDAVFSERGTRIVLEVKTTITNGFRIDTPVGYFGECETAGTDLSWIGDQILIEAEEFARLRTAGAIEPLSPAWAVTEQPPSETPSEV